MPDPAALGISGIEVPHRGAVIVIGGSRGFGAALTLALLACGYAVHVVYSESTAMATELGRLAGPAAERLFLHQADARDGVALAELAQAVRRTDAGLIGLVLNAAPPPLPMGVTGKSAEVLVQYVADSLSLTAAPLGSFLPLLDKNEGWILFCSSSAVNAPPRDLPQFVAAKTALEGLARWSAAEAPTLRTVVIRPPKLRTDLMNTPSGRLEAVPTEPIAKWIVERIASGDLQPGLSILAADTPEATLQ